MEDLTLLNEQGKLQDLMNLLIEGTFKALILHAERKKVTLNFDEVKEPIIQTILSEHEELREVLKEALEAHMGAPMYAYLINLYCNSWACKVLNVLSEKKSSESAVNTF